VSTVLITGAEGMIGSRLSAHLKQHGFLVTEFEGDVTEWSNWTQYSSYNRMFVIHLAALAGVRTSFEQPDVYYHNNVVGTHMALRYNKLMGTKMLYASSSNVYEWWGNPYAATKKMNEAQAIGHQAIGMRFHTVWPGRDDMLFKMLQNNQVTYINRNHTRDFIHVDDLVEGIRLTMNNFDRVYVNNPVVDYGTGHATPIEAVAKLMGFVGEYRDDNPPGERIHTQANVNWLLELGWTPQRNILDVSCHPK